MVAAKSSDMLVSNHPHYKEKQLRKSQELIMYIDKTTIYKEYSL